MENLNELALFAGAGGGILGGHLLGWRTVCAVEWEQYPASVLCARQNDKILPPFPIWDDVQTFDGRPWRGIVDVVSGGFPCQDISAAGGGAGITGERSSMWKHMARIIGEVRPQYVFVENSPMLTTRGLGVVLADLSALGFDAKWGVVSAADVGANHQRERIWIRANKRKIANTTSIGSHNQENKCVMESQRGGELQPIKSRHTSKMAYTSEIGFSGEKAKQRMGGKFRFAECGMDRNWWAREPEFTPRTIERNMGGMVDGVAARVDRLKAIGNGQVPLCAATAWGLLK
jgi:DNA (cytosine-5)-methyltransferase 1